MSTTLQDLQVHIMFHMNYLFIDVQEFNTISHIFQAYVVLGQFLVLKKNRDLFVDWLKDYAGANSKQASDCYQCLSDWCDEFL